MGSVFRAEDVTDGTVVAVKMLQGRWDDQEAAWRRLRKEARLLAEVNNPYVANLIEVNEHDGAPYLVMEFVDGESLSKVLARRRRLTEAEAAAVMADVARALTDAHRRGIVHRDVKPENILLEGVRGQGTGVSKDGMASSLTPDPCPLTPLRVKLCDFGLARHVLQSASLNVTEVGTVVGTPFYASPEQCTGKPIDPRTDVYAMGATLFHLLAGRPPFLADTVLGMTHLHANQPPPPLRQFNPDVSDGVCPDRREGAGQEPRRPPRRRRGLPARPRTAAARRGRQRRRPPAAAAGRPGPRAAIRLDLGAGGAAGTALATRRQHRTAQPGGRPARRRTSPANRTPPAAPAASAPSRRPASSTPGASTPSSGSRAAGSACLREYSRGVFKWLATWSELKPRDGGGTTLTHQVRIEPRNLLGRIVAAVEVSAKGKRAVERVYRRIDAYACGKLGRPEASDPFEPPPALKPAGRRRLEQLLDRLLELRLDPAVVEKLGEFLLDAAAAGGRPHPAAGPGRPARPRPGRTDGRLSARRPRGTAGAALGHSLPDLPHSVRRQGRAAALGEHEHCPACDLDFKPDFAEAVEMIFRVHPQVRPSELAVYCVGGPAHSPHVAAQVRVAPGETVELELALAEGAYRLRGPQLPYALDFAVRPTAAVRRWDLRLARGAAPHRRRRCRRGGRC